MFSRLWNCPVRCAYIRQSCARRPCTHRISLPAIFWGGSHDHINVLGERVVRHLIRLGILICQYRTGRFHLSLILNMGAKILNVLISENQKPLKFFNHKKMVLIWCNLDVCFRLFAIFALCAHIRLRLGKTLQASLTFCSQLFRIFVLCTHMLMRLGRAKINFASALDFFVYLQSFETKTLI